MSEAVRCSSIQGSEEVNSKTAPWAPDHIAQATGIAPATLVAVLAGTQRLTREHIGMLARYFQVSPGVFTFGE